MFLARLEGAPLSKAYTPYVVEGGATDNVVQKLYLEAYSFGLSGIRSPGSLTISLALKSARRNG